MQHSSFHKPAAKKRLSGLQVGLGVVVLLLISGALTAGKFLSRRSTDSRSQAAGGQRYVVCPSGSPGANGCDFVGLAGLQQGIDRVPTGSTFLMKPGVYRITQTTEYVDPENGDIFPTALRFDNGKTLSIIGEGDVMVDDRNSNNQVPMILTANGSVIVEGITFSSASQNAIVSMGSSNFTIKKSVVKDTKQFADIVFNSTGRFLAERNQIIRGIGDGILVRKGTAVIAENTVSNKVAGNNHDVGHGIDCLSNARCTIRNNTVFNNAGVGIIGSKTSSIVEISGNYSYGNKSGNYNDWPNWPPAGNFSTPPGGSGGTTPTPVASPSTSPVPVASPLGVRNVSGTVSCRLNNKPIANVPVVAFGGRIIAPEHRLNSTKTGANGQYTLSMNSNDPLFTVRLSANDRNHDMAFVSSGNPGVGCNAGSYTLCKYLQIPIGTTKPGFDFTTSAQASNLRAYHLDANTVVFEFTQAKNTLNQNIQRYVLRLDNKADGWFSSTSDYFVQVPKKDGKGIGECANGLCKVTSRELNAIRPFKYGTYGMGVNPIWDSQVANQPTVELCRADAVVTATQPSQLPVCATNVTCQSSATKLETGAVKCRKVSPAPNGGQLSTEQYCCVNPGDMILNNRCVPKPPAP